MCQSQKKVWVNNDTCFNKYRYIIDIIWIIAVRKCFTSRGNVCDALEIQASNKVFSYYDSVLKKYVCEQASKY